MNMKNSNRLSEIEINDAHLPAPSDATLQERKIAIFELLEFNEFTLLPRGGREAPPGPYKLALSVREGRLVLDVSSDAGKAAEFHLSLSPFREVVRDYSAILNSYNDAVKRLPLSKIEAIDMGRRGIHNEAARLLQERLEGKIRIDDETARRMFTLICALM
ncbi:MAG: UPF0262 family protein [Albidovulum sp.]|nr:UPF0262 family protein [Albidovulum sp.]MDE0307821.1 UPF0262 family protein [Albidovulum sp.]MDE0533625.1 UPF0262 family protein [Albidovulum sp.]